MMCNFAIFFYLIFWIVGFLSLLCPYYSLLLSCSQFQPVLFCFTCSLCGGLYKFCLSILCFLVYFFIQACIFFIYLVSFFVQYLSQKDTTPVSFFSLIPVGHNYYCFYIWLFSLSPFHFQFLSFNIHSETINLCINSVKNFEICFKKSYFLQKVWNIFHQFKIILYLCRRF